MGRVPVTVLLLAVLAGCSKKGGNDGTPGAAADSTPPIAGSVSDGVGADIDVQSTGTSIAANWTGFDDPESGITGYEWAVGTTAGAANVKLFTAVGMVTSALDFLALVDGTTYYVTVRAANGSGLQTMASSDGVFVDGSAPSAGTVNDGIGADVDAQTSTTTISANWSGFGDAHSNVVGYEWAIGETAGGTNVQGYTSVGLATSAANAALSLAAGTTYYVTVRATNGTGLQTTRSSDGVTVDVSGPSVGTVNDGTGADVDKQRSTDTISANWSGFGDAESGIAGYEWSIGTTAGGTDTQDYTSVGLATSATNDTLTLEVGTTYYVTVRATNGAGLQITGTSDGVLVKLEAEGVLDSSFGGGDGIVDTSISGGPDYVYGLVIQSDGKIVVGGECQAGLYRDFAVARYNADGTLDATFDTDGIVTTSTGDDDLAYAIALQTDGKIVAAGGDGVIISLVRYNTDGSLDATFGGDGIVTTVAGPSSTACTVAVQSDGKIVAAGWGGGADGDVAVVRYNADGTLDTTFGGGDGIAVTAVTGNFDVASGVAIQTDGKIVVVGLSFAYGIGFLAVRYNADGTLDTTFSGDGIVTTPISHVDRGIGVALQTDGKIVAVGYSYEMSGVCSIALVRYEANGTLDATFGGDGIVTTSLSGGVDWGNAAALQPNGKIVVAGLSDGGTGADVAVLRYNADGSLDTTFGGGSGFVTTDLGGPTDAAYALALEPDWDIVVGGEANDNFVVLRYK